MSPVTCHFLHLGFGFAEAGDAVAVFPLTAFFKKRNTLETFEDIAPAAESGRRAQTAML
jgi:hypothetical protein